MNQNFSTHDDIALMVASLGDCEGVQFDKDADYNITCRRINAVEFTELNKKPNVIHFISQHDRPGAYYFFQYLEQTYFEPDTPANAAYEYRIMRWGPLLWSIATIPTDKRPAADDAAEKSKMRIADGVPFRLGIVLAATRPEKMASLDKDTTQDMIWFPVCGSNAYTLENQTNSPVYESGGKQDVHIESMFRIKKMFAERGIDLDKFLGDSKFRSS